MKTFILLAACLVLVGCDPPDQSRISNSKYRYADFEADVELIWKLPHGWEGSKQLTKATLTFRPSKAGAYYIEDGAGTANKVFAISDEPGQEKVFELKSAAILVTYSDGKIIERTKLTAE